MCVFDWLEMETDVAVVASEGRSWLAWVCFEFFEPAIDNWASSSSSSFSPDDRFWGREDVSLGGVPLSPAVLTEDELGEC